MNDFFGVMVSILGCGIVWNLIGITLKLERIADALEPDEDEEEGGGGMNISKDFIKGVAIGALRYQ